MKTLNENIIEEDGLKIEFYGWTNFANKEFPDLSDEIWNNQIKEKGDIVPNYVPVPGKEDYVKTLKRANLLAEMLVCARLFVKGIKFDGNYHQDGKYGCPLLKVNDLGLFKWTCSFRAWGDLMEQAGYGYSYCDWAWDSPEEPVTPDLVEGERLLGE